ncbi:MAG: phage tail sheath subtilisin-like domain-containing protein [Litorilinea sp.]
MPEYLAPGVYIEERSFRSKSIEGVSTSTTAFVGATRYGPTAGEPELMTSFNQFERIYGGLDPLVYDGAEVHNYLAHGVRAFFDNGGARLYIARAFTLPDEGTTTAVAPIPAPVAVIATAEVTAQSGSATSLAALNTAIQGLVRAKSASINVLQFAAQQVLSARFVGTAAPAITYDYGTGDNVATQLEAFIGGLSDTAPAGATESEQAAVQAALDDLRSLIDNADAVYAAAESQSTAATNAQRAVSDAFAVGQADGNATPNGVLDAVVDVETSVTAMLNPVNSSLNVVNLRLSALTTPTTNLMESLSDMVDTATAQDVVEAAEDITEATERVITAAANTAQPIEELALALTIARRVTLRRAMATFGARFPGAAGNMTLIITGRIGPNALTAQDGRPALPQIRAGDLLVIDRSDTARIYQAMPTAISWSFEDEDGAVVALSSLDVSSVEVYPLSLSVEVQLPGKYAQPMLWANLTISDLAGRLRDSVTQIFAEDISNRMQALETPLVLQASGLRAARLAGYLIGLSDWSEKLASSDADRFTSTMTFELVGGTDGARPDAEAYRGAGDDDSIGKSGLISLEDLEEISIVAAPGYSHAYDSRAVVVSQINQFLISHCERLKYRVAVLDSPDNQSLSGVRNYRAVLDSKYAAVYYPWVRVLDPISERVIIVPPSGFMAGIYARNDNENGVHKAPANEVVRGAIGLEVMLNKAQQDVLNPLGIDCLRYFEGRGFRVWGARTISSDPEWKYLNIRRFFIYLEASIDRSTQWAVFEPNGEALWTNIRRTVEDFLYNEWKEERLAGVRPEEAFFVRCDRTTMTQNDLDNGRLICLIGVAPLYPAEFVIFRIGQWTADSSS